MVLSTGSIIISVFETKANMKKLREMAYYSCDVKVIRNGHDFLAAMSDELVPGDIIEIPE
jgi:cation-transporting ATPase 13A3/4/5